MKNFTIFTMIALILGCNNQATTTDSKTDSLSQKSEKKTEIQYIENDNFSSSALNDYSIKSMTDKYGDFLKCTKKPQMNNQDSSIVDTIYSYHNSNNKIEFYRAVHADFVIGFDVTDSRFELMNGIKTGISKEQFIKNLNIKVPVDDTVKIGSMEGTQYLTFYFNKGILKRIDLYTYIY